MCHEIDYSKFTGLQDEDVCKDEMLSNMQLFCPSGF